MYITLTLCRLHAVIYYFLLEVVSFVYFALNEDIYKTKVLSNVFKLFSGRSCTKTKIYKL